MFAEYSVGWICAQQAKFVAARAMLDIKHGQPASRGTADNNAYFLGSIGAHNVVIACLPSGAAGATSAATVAADMQRTFRHIRCGLLVGDGSGAPSVVDDIRLGDVVVGIPTNDTGGIIQFGMESVKDNTRHASDASAGSSRDGTGSKDSNGRRCSLFVRTRCLNAPPRVLLTALNNLRAEHTLNGDSVCDNLAQAAAKYPLARSQFAAPVVRSWGTGDEQAETDRLYQANHVHVGSSSSSSSSESSVSGGSVDESICDKCDGSMLVRRPYRDGNRPAVHYGKIASGNVEIECRKEREKAKRALGALCFEREAAGLMDNFPCLVIRGISDYANSHKSRRWQGFAAATAAAFAKELLEYTPVQEVQEMATIVEVLKDGKSMPLLLMLTRPS
jgi:nucleoside phosphorylase